MSLPELEQLEALIERLGDHARVETITRVCGYPIHGVVMGSDDESAPCLLLVGGVHGLERIGTKVVLAYLGTLAERLQWDELTRNALQRSRVAAIPLLNPVGMRSGTRSNGSGVDLMRNGPTNGVGRGSFLVGGQRLSPLLPWYMGSEGRLEPESDALIDFVTRNVLCSVAAIALDVHSGFGFQDRLWFPYARTTQPFPHTPEVYALRTTACVTSSVAARCRQRILGWACGCSCSWQSMGMRWRASSRLRRDRVPVSKARS